jgi:hypothetical protein
VQATDLLHTSAMPCLDAWVCMVWSLQVSDSGSLTHFLPPLPPGYFLSAARPGGVDPKCEDHEPGCSDVARRGLCISQPGEGGGGGGGFTAHRVVPADSLPSHTSSGCMWSYAEEYALLAKPC